MGVGSHRFWRLADIKSAAGREANWRTMATVELRDSGGTAYTGVLADGSGNNNIGTPASLVDGNASTYYRTGTGTNPYITFDLGSPLPVHSIFFQAPAAGSGETLNRTINYAKLMYSDDGVYFHYAETISLGTWGALGDSKTHACTSAGGTAVGGLAAPFAHRYWRLTNMENSDFSTEIWIGELKFYQGATQRVISTVTASGTSAANGGIHVASNVKDGSSATKWASNSPDGVNLTSVTLDIDFGSSQSWDKIEIVDNGGRTPTYTDLYYSDDGSTWHYFTSIRFHSAGTAGDVRSFTFGLGNGQRGYTPVSGGPGAHRYWRMNAMRQSAGGAQLGLATVELRDAGGTALTVAGVQASSYANTTTNNPKKLVDGNNTTEWASGTDYGGWIMFDLGSPQEVRSLYMMARASSAFGQGPRAFSWEYSDDGRNWTAWGDIRVAPFTANNQTRTVTFEASAAIGGKAPPASAHRYWKFINVRPQGNWGQQIGLAECKFYQGATQRTVSAAAARDSFSGSFLPGNMIDNNNSSVWTTSTTSTEASPTYFSFDLGSAQTFDKVQFTARTGSVPVQWPWQFTLQYSDDNATWVDFGEFDMTFIDTNNEVHDITFSAPSGTPGTGPDGSLFNALRTVFGFGLAPFVN